MKHYFLYRFNLTITRISNRGKKIIKTRTFGSNRPELMLDLKTIYKTFERDRVIRFFIEKQILVIKIINSFL